MRRHRLALAIKAAVAESLRGLPADAISIYRTTWNFDWCGRHSCVSMRSNHERMIMGIVAVWF
jgi:hypothetical protein